MSRRNRRNYNRGNGRRASRRNGNNPFNLSRRQRKELKEGVLWYSEWLKAQKNQNQKNTNRRMVTEKVKKGQEKILGVLDKVATKLDQMLALFVKDDKREKKKEEKKKHESLAKKWWKSKSTKDKLSMAGNALAFGTAVAGLITSLMADEEEIPMEEKPKGDEAPKPPPPGVTEIQGARLVLGNNVDLDGLNKSFLDRFLAAVREYQEKTGKLVRVNSAYRSLADQKRLYEADKAANGGVAKKTAEPGKSMHEYGFALDSNTDELAEMERMGILDKYDIGRECMHKNENGEWTETWHLEDKRIKDFKNKLRKKGAESEYSKRMKQYLGATGLTDESDVAAVNALMDQKALVDTTVAETWNAMSPLLMAQAAAQAQGPEQTVKLAEGGTVELIAGEAGPELVLPMNNRGSEILAKSIKEAFVLMSKPRKKGRSVDAFSKFFETTFLPELKRRMSN